jgi:formiminotetrahydrofolate cyclodeaminase
MATSPLDPGETSLRDFIEAVGSADAPHGAVSTAAVAGGLGSSLLLMVAALPQTRSDSVADRAKLLATAID